MVEQQDKPNAALQHYPFRAFQTSVMEFGEALYRTFDAMCEGILRLFYFYTERQDPAAKLLFTRRKYGGNATDAARWPGQWVTVECGAWLCGDCKSDEHQLYCNHHCHEKDG